MSLPAFADLLERLIFTPGRNAKLALLRRWFATQPDPDRGIGLAAIAGELSFTLAKPSIVRELAAGRTDPELLAMSHDYVGDLAETVALIWPEPEPRPNRQPPDLSEVVETLELAAKADIARIMAEWLDVLDAGGRLALI
jgi:DNA ligase-1